METQDQDATDGDNGGDIGLAKNRSRRSKIDKTGRLAALAQLKKAKATGEKYKYEVKDEGDVYDVVDEAEYSKIVQERQEDDWIVDDGSGYVEDGREIFDEDEGMAVITEKGPDGQKNRKKTKNPNIRAPDSKPKSIKSMFAAAAVKPKKKVQKDVNLNEDALLGDIMAELHQDPSSTLMPAPMKLKKKQPSKPAYNPFSTTTTPKRSAPSVTKAGTPRNLNVSSGLTNGHSAPPAKKKVLKPPPSVEDMHPVEEIEEFDTPDIPDTEEDEEPQINEPESMDVGDIDFDDDFDASQEKKTEQKFDTKAQTKTEPIAEPLQNGNMEVEMSKDISMAWESATADSTADVPLDVQVDPSKLPLVANEEGEQVLQFFWLDAYEDHYRHPGVVYLFGKVWIESAKQHVSCCLSVKDIERRVYLLPRTTKVDPKTKEDSGEPVGFVDVYQEFNDQVANKHKIMKFKSRKVTRQYAFEKADVPAESDYLMVQYSADLPALPSTLSGRTFSHVFGTNTSSLEMLLLDRKMKGPCWLDVKMPQVPNPAVSWCKVEATINRPENISLTTNPPSLPPLTVMTLNLQTLLNPKSHQNEVIGVACLLQHKFQLDKPAPKPHFQQHFCAITKPSDCIFPFDFKDQVARQGKSMKVDIMGTERALLGFLLAKIHKTDPDVIVGHDIFGFDLEVLLHRVGHNKIPHWSRLGRLKRTSMPKFSTPGKGGAGSNACSGRLVADVKISARELIRCRSYDLTELARHILKEERKEQDVDLIRNFYNKSEYLLQYIEWNLVDASYVLRILYELNALPLALQITNICGNVMARTLLGGRSERNEYLLLHAFHEKDFICPDKQYGKKAVQHEPGDDDEADHNNTTSSKKGSRRKPAYAGGLVLDPKKGFYDKFILLLDFNSLYPSIIQEYNICFTTISRAPGEDQQEEDEMNLELPDPELEPGVLPTEIRKLVQSRRQVKQLMKNPDLAPEMHMQYDIRQKALKLTANSMYGCLGFTFSRFFAKPLAALITGKGREILMKTRDLVQNMNLDVIYGDTDSIMVNSNCTDLEQVFKLGNKIKNEVNKLYKLLEIDIDGVFKSMLLLKKKKYAALNVTKVGDKYVTTEEMKGLDIVRRDWSLLAKEAGKYVIQEILSGNNQETILDNIHLKLQQVGKDVADGKVPVEMFQITKALTKNPEDYPDKKSLPHVQVALRINSRGGKKMRAGDAIFYVVCEDGTNLPASQRAYSCDELAKSDTLKIDNKYYLAQQVHPVVSRLCDPIDGTDTAHIAECLGLDPSSYRHSIASRERDEDDALLGGEGISEEEKYKDCDRLKFSCPSCGKEIILDSVLLGAGTLLEYSLSKCPNPTCTSKPADFVKHIQNRLTMLARSHTKKYYDGWLKCEDSGCGARTRQLPLVFFRGQPVCSVCNRGALHAEYTDSDLYHQLCFYRFLFDTDRALHQLDKDNKIMPGSEMYREEYKKLKSHMDSMIRKSAYSQVNLGSLFEGLFSLNK